MRFGRIAATCAAIGLIGCGGSDGGGGGAATCTPGASAAVSISATGISPVNVCVQPGGTVTFTNADTTGTHDIEFETSGCPTVGNIASGGQVTATFSTQQNCTFHDGKAPSNTAFRGTVAVTAITVGGGGY